MKHDNLPSTNSSKGKDTLPGFAVPSWVSALGGDTSKEEPLANESNSRLSLLRQTRGLSSVEYIILLSLIAVAALATWKSIGGKVAAETTKANDALQTL